jgi:predicted TPR repeat methyltransferase
MSSDRVTPPSTSSSHHLIPPGVNEQDAELLRRAYDLSDQDEGQQLYADWAATYDTTMLDGLGYVSPARLVERFAAAVDWRDRLVLDVGCGTGLVGVGLAEHGFASVDGLDLSQAMLDQARQRGIYGELLQADLTKSLALADATYNAVVCNGTFTSGHVDAKCLDELLRVLVPGGVLAAAVHHSVWDTFGFGEAFDRLVAEDRIELIEVVEATYYESSTAPDGRLCLFRRL